MVLIPEGGKTSGWETPDPGFNQPSNSNEQLNDVVDFNLISDQDDETNQETPKSFILMKRKRTLPLQRVLKTSHWKKSGKERPSVQKRTMKQTAARFYYQQ